MKYILDFDRTLFDTDAFVAATKRDGLPVAKRITPDVWHTYNVRDFLYPEVLTWLQSKNRADLHILTAITPELGPLATEFQTQKLHSGTFESLVDGITFVIGDKGTYVKEIAAGADAVFVDDKLSQHISVKEHAPSVHCVLMQRPQDSVASALQTDITTIGNLYELDAIL